MHFLVNGVVADLYVIIMFIHIFWRNNKKVTKMFGSSTAVNLQKRN